MPDRSQKSSIRASMRRMYVATPTKRATGRTRSANAVKPSPNSVARATRANATTVADTTVRKMAARLKTAR